MKDTKKIKYNLFIGVIGQAVTLLLGILVPKLVLTNFGSEVNGLLSSVTNIYAYVALVEAGVAAASCQALYKAIADKSRNDVNSVLSATNKYYHKTGLVYLFLIIIFSLLYPALVKSEIPYHTCALVILFNGTGNVVNYFFHGKYLILLKADGKNYIRTGVEIFTTTFKQISKIVLISMGFDVVFVQAAAMLVSLFQMIYITLYIKKNYSWIDLSAKPNYKAISQSKNVIVHQINYLVVSNTDTVILTAFSTLKTVSVYSLYIMLCNMVDKVLHVIRDALEFKIANYYHTDKEEFIKVFTSYEVYYISFGFALYSILDYFILPFLSVYTAGVTDTEYVIYYLPLIFVSVKLFSVMRYPFDAMIHISGHFKQTQNSAIAESVLNIIISVILVKPLGISGVLLGTLLASLYRTNYLIMYVYKNKIVDKSISGSYKCIGINLALFALLDVIGSTIGAEFDSYLKMIAAAFPATVLVVAIYFATNSVCFPEAFSYARSVVLKKTRKS